MKLDKAEVARRQLGTALSLYLDSKDPVSVHSLASAGAEIAEGLAEEADVKPLRVFVLEQRPDLDKAKYYGEKKKFANALKHYNLKGGVRRDDEKELDEFRSYNNEYLIFDGWINLVFAGIPKPIEADVFLNWMLAREPYRFADEPLAQEYKRSLELLFPKVADMPPQAQKRLLLRTIRKARSDLVMMSDKRIDPRPLLLADL